MSLVLQAKFAASAPCRKRMRATLLRRSPQHVPHWCFVCVGSYESVSHDVIWVGKVTKYM